LFRIRSKPTGTKNLSKISILFFLLPLKAVVRMQRSSSWWARSLRRWSRLLHPH
jgi:hypothetical protein